MKEIHKWLAIALIASAAILWTSTPSVRASGQIEYKYVYAQEGETESTLNSLAAQGWELVAVMRPEGNQHGLVLKRSH